jgi:hypothetical protein
MANRSQFWAAVSVLVTSPVAVAAGAAKGTYDAASGNGAFIEGFDQTARSVVGSAEEFGAEHGEVITRALVGGAAAAIGGRIVTETLKHIL